MSKTPKVLIVEDDKFISKAMSMQFKAKKFMVKAVLNAEDGLELLKIWIPDAIILDILLPGIDGYEFLITGGTDYCGFPMRRGILGIRKKITISG